MTSLRCAFYLTSLFFKIFLDSCFEKDIDYYGNIVTTYPNILNRMSCQTLCMYDPDCKFWTYGVTGTWGNQCVLKTSDEGRQSLSGLISGPKFCRYCDVIGKCVVSLDFH